LEQAVHPLLLGIILFLLQAPQMVGAEAGLLGSVQEQAAQAVLVAAGMDLTRGLAGLQIKEIAVAARVMEIMAAREQMAGLEIDWPVAVVVRVP
jgi:hypothetical protein